MKRLGQFLRLAIFAVVLCAPVTFGQQAADGQQQPPDPKEVDKDVDMLRKDIRSQKKQLVAANLTLTDAQAERFWPVYDQYTAELVKINDKKYEIIKQYANSFDTLTDAQCEQMARDAIKVDESVAQLRLKYIPIFKGVVGAKSTARFFQIDRRLTSVIDLQLASAIPMVQQ